MGESTAIAWTDHTFNIAWGCFKISPGCKNCYADTFATNRVGLKIWGPPDQSERRVFKQAHWNEPLKWQRAAGRASVIRRVFSSSMCDIFEDHPTIIGELPRLWSLIRQTPNLHWQLLTKRHDRIASSLPDDWGAGYPNVWLGVSVENQEYADIRIPALLKVPALIRFISYEPALGQINLSDYLSVNGQVMFGDGPLPALDWVIYGGESGPGYRKADVQWARDVRDQCSATETAFFHKQSSAPRTEMGIELDGVVVRQYPTVGERRTVVPMERRQRA